MRPGKFAVTKDGKYAYVTMALPPSVFKVRLQDLAVEAVADLSKYWPLECHSAVLDETETKLFVADIWHKLLAIDTRTMSVVRFFDNLPVIGLGLSRYAPLLMVWHGGGTVHFVNTQTYEVTVFQDDEKRFVNIRESGLTQDKWYVLSGPEEETGGYKAGIYDRRRKAWDVALTVPTFAGAPRDLLVSPAEQKLYVPSLEGFLREGRAYGSLYSVDLSARQVKPVPIDGGAASVEVSRDARWLFVGAAGPIPNVDTVLVVDAQSDTVASRINLERTRFGSPYTAITDLGIDPANPNVLLGVSGEANALFKVRLDTRSLSDVLIFNEESLRPQWFVRRPGQASTYIQTGAGPYAFELDLDKGAIRDVVKLPSYPGEVAINRAGRALMAQGQSFLEFDPTNMTVLGAHPLRFSAAPPAVWSVVLSQDQKKLYTISWSGEQEGSIADTFLSIDAATYQVEAVLRLSGGNFAFRPYELPDRPKAYAVGGMPHGGIVIHVIGTDNYSVQKTMTFEETGQPGISLGTAWPYAYDSRSRTLFVGASRVVLAVDTERDVIKKVIFLGDAAKVIGLEPDQLPYHHGTALVYHPGENYLYIAHGAYSFVSVYDVGNGRFLPPLISLHGFSPAFMFANDDFSRIYTLNTRSDSVSVIDVRSKTEEMVIDLHGSLPSPEAPRAGIGVSRPELSFSFEMGAKAPGSQVVWVWMVPGGGDVNWAATSSGDWLAVSPASGRTPAGVNVSVNPAKLGPGSYTGAVTVSSAGLPSQAVKVTLRVTAPVPSISGLVNAANFQPGMVPGGLATLFGKNLSLVTGAELPGGATSYKGVFVAVEGQRVPLLAVSNAGGQEQINFQVPFELGAPARVRVEVNNNGSAATLDNVAVLRVQPGIFEYTPPGSSTRYAAAVKLDGSVVGPANPASRGEAMSIFLTGLGPVLPVLRTGEAGPANPPAMTWLQPEVGVGGTPAEVLFSGYAPGFLGLYQVNVVIPESAPAGTVNLDVLVGGVPSQTSKIAVR